MGYKTIEKEPERAAKMKPEPGDALQFDGDAKITALPYLPYMLNVGDVWINLAEARYIRVVPDGLFIEYANHTLCKFNVAKLRGNMARHEIFEALEVGMQRYHAWEEDVSKK